MLCDGFVVAGDACANWRLSWKLGSDPAAVANNDDRGMPGFLVDFLSTSLTSHLEIHRLRPQLGPHLIMDSLIAPKSPAAVADLIYSGWCLRRRLEDRRRSHRACQAPHPEPGTAHHRHRAAEKPR
jgi:hypothetical protein